MMGERPWGPRLTLKSPLASVVDDVIDEHAAATAAYGPFRSAHEAYAILLEEVDELWTEVKRKQTERDRTAMRREAVQVAAMAIRFAVDICGEEEK